MNAPASLSTPSLGQLCLQVHPARAPGLDLAAFSVAAEAVARRTPGVRGFGLTTSEEEGGYANLVFACESPEAAWPVLRESLFALPEAGPGLADACIVLCTGASGWDDGRVLHHFDAAQVGASLAPSPDEDDEDDGDGDGAPDDGASA